MRILLAAFLTLACSACGIVYTLPTRQGNVIDQKQLDKLQSGMSRDQVKFLLGTPLAATPFRDDRWDYVGYYRSPRGAVVSRTVSLYFDGGRLARMEGVQASGETLTRPDVESILEQEKKDAQDTREAETGITISPPGT